ncbi:MAG: glycoside hydrolase family 16 protein [Alphaproteobacteria bacterium]|nr:MAG: glycoside hydrolase family 16 protein [Alphaproteobacteria bacterium]
MLLAAAGCDAAEDAAAEGPADEGQGQLVWADEFDGGVIDRTRWAFDIDCWGGGNDERQCYTNSERNASIEDGRLIITALNEPTEGPALPSHMITTANSPVATMTKPFSSARLVTRGKAAWKYGKIEVRAKLPQGQGTWPAIWMLPEDNVYGGWARSGEIDILEAVNLGVECDNDCEDGGENTILGTLHFGGAWPENDLASTEFSYPPILDGEFHTFGIVWSEGRFTWTVDGEPYSTRTAEEWFTTESSAPNAPFDQRFYLILNLAIGGRLPEGRALGGVSEEGFPKRMEVDWVRVWQCGEDVATGKACVRDGD